jgi:hypothetical protein
MAPLCRPAQQGGTVRLYVDGITRKKVFNSGQTRKRPQKKRAALLSLKIGVLFLLLHQVVVSPYNDGSTSTRKLLHCIARPKHKQLALTRVMPCASPATSAVCSLSAPIGLAIA